MDQVNNPDPAADEARDVLAAEEFPVPAPDPDLHHGPVVLPDDPAGTVEPHDVLAAEEFPMPATRPHEVTLASGSRRKHFVIIAAAVVLVLVRLLRARHRRAQA